MAKGFTLSIAADTRTFQQSVKKGITEPLEDAADILEEIGRDGGRDLEQVERAARDSQRETEGVKKEFSELQKAIRDTGRKSRTDYADPVSDSSDRVKQDLDEVKNEAKQNAAEMFSSFDGSFESIADAAQGTLGGLTAGLGGIGGMAVAAAGAAGIGLIASALQASQAETERLAEVTNAAFAAMLDAGTRYVGESIVQDNIKDLIEDTERLKSVTKDANATGLERSLLVRAQAGDSAALAEAERLVAERRAELVSENQKYIDQNGEANLLLVAQIGDLDKLTGRLNDTEGAYQSAGDAVGLAYDSMGGAAEAFDARTTRVNDAATARLEGYARSVGAIPSSVTTRVNVDLSAAERALERFSQRRPKVYVEGRIVDRFGREFV